MAKVTKDTLLIELLEKKEARKILEKYNLPCLSCPFAAFELQNLTLGEVAKFYQLKLKKILKELNKVLKKND